MSRYRIPVKSERLEVVVGYDHPLETFFVQVFDYYQLPEHDECVFWAGGQAHSLPTLEALQEVLPVDVTLPPLVLDRLQDDYAHRTGSSPLQRALLTLRDTRSSQE